MQGKISPTPSNEAQNYVGIDVCKDWLDVHVHPAGKGFRVANTPDGVRELKKRLAKTLVELIAMEATGKYHRLVQRMLHAAGFSIAVVNPLWARLYAEGIGQLAKTDGIDARVLALMAESGKYEAYAPIGKALLELQELLGARAALIADMTAMKNRSGDSEVSFIERLYDRRIAAAEKDLARLDAEIDARVAADPDLARRVALLVTIPGVGRVTALALVIGLPELGHDCAKAMSLLVGVAPITNKSGAFVGQSRIRGGRGHVRSAIYFAAVSAARCNPALAATYKRLRANGKKPKQALVAVMRKLVVLANTLIRENRNWTPVRP
jgi:transposase